MNLTRVSCNPPKFLEKLYKLKIATKALNGIICRRFSIFRLRKPVTTAALSSATHVYYPRSSRCYVIFRKSRPSEPSFCRNARGMLVEAIIYRKTIVGEYFIRVEGARCKYTPACRISVLRCHQGRALDTSALEIYDSFVYVRLYAA